MTPNEWRGNPAPVEQCSFQETFWLYFTAKHIQMTVKIQLIAVTLNQVA